MAATFDKDLEFLRQLTDEQLDPLVRHLMYGKDFSKRRTEQLSSNPVVKEYFPKHTYYVDDIIEEIQRYGANTLVTLARLGKGVVYKEILFDVCKKMKIKNIKTLSVEEQEEKLVREVIARAVKKMTSEQLQEFAKKANLNTNHYTAQAVLTALATASTPFSLILATGVFVPFQGYIGGTALGAGLFLGTLAFIGLSGIFAGFAITGPAYRVTIPACVIIACLRNELKRKAN